jgi:lysozyme family protein
MADFEIAIPKVIKHEGGYVNDPKDSGGETKYGISKRAYPNLDIKNLTLQNAKAIYKKDYWDRIKGDLIKSQEIAESIFDFAVNAGVKTASKMAQLVLDVKPDGIIGPKTLKALNNFNKDLFIASFTLAKIARYVYLCERNPKNRKFFYGWVRRALS